MTEQLGLNAADVALIVGVVQCGLIWIGLKQMQAAAEQRHTQVKAQSEMLGQVGARLDAQSEMLGQVGAGLDAQAEMLAKVGTALQLQITLAQGGNSEIRDLRAEVLQRSS